MPPIWFPGHLRARKIWIDDALGGAARCRLITLRQRGIGAFDVVPIYAVGLQADRIVRAISLGQGSRCRQNSDGRQNRQSPNGHLNLPRDGHSINAPKQTDHVSVNSHSRASRRKGGTGNSEVRHIPHPPLSGNLLLFFSMKKRLSVCPAHSRRREPPYSFSVSTGSSQSWERGRSSCTIRCTLNADIHPR